MSIHIRGLNGEREVEYDANTTLGELREAGVIAEGLVVRFNGEVASDSQEISDGDTLVTSAPAAKHGA